MKRLLLSSLISFNAYAFENTIPCVSEFDCRIEQEKSGGVLLSVSHDGHTGNFNCSSHCSIERDDYNVTIKDPADGHTVTVTNCNSDCKVIMNENGSVTVVTGGIFSDFTWKDGVNWFLTIVK